MNKQLGRIGTITSGLKLSGSMEEITLIEATRFTADLSVNRIGERGATKMRSVVECVAKGTADDEFSGGVQFRRNYRRQISFNMFGYQK